MTQTRKGHGWQRLDGVVERLIARMPPEEVR